ncbi:MAG: methionine ABC transporter permease [Eubacteriales bacterium]|nr:methionine ABC transporter permease [Eubacteriales bacterium]
MSFSQMVPLMWKGILETLYMTVVSTGLAYVLGIPLGVILIVTDADGVNPIKPVHDVLGVIINVFRSVPFIILLFLMLPVTKALVGTQIGSIAIIPPLTASAAPYIARMVESSLKEVDRGVIEAAKSMGASPWQIVYKVLLPEAKPSLLIGAAIVMTTVLGYTAMAGMTGGGGLGAIAANYGYYRWQMGVMLVATFLLILITQIIQEVWMRSANAIDKRRK